MKKPLLLTVALAALALPAFAWDGNRRMAVTMSVVHPLLTEALVNPLFSEGVRPNFGIDIGFEYAPIPHVSSKVNFRFIAPGSPWVWSGSMRVSLEGRWYPQGNYVQGWFASGSIQFQRSPRLRGRLDLHTFSFFIGGGYKAVFNGGKRAAFVMEPRLDFGREITGRVANYYRFFDMDVFDLWEAGIYGPRFRLPVGVAF